MLERMCVECVGDKVWYARECVVMVERKEMLSSALSVEYCTANEPHFE